jgi:hypothetical protein
MRSLALKTPSHQTSSTVKIISATDLLKSQKVAEDFDFQECEDSKESSNDNDSFFRNAVMHSARSKKSDMHDDENGTQYFTKSSRSLIAESKIDVDDNDITSKA